MTLGPSIFPLDNRSSFTTVESVSGPVVDIEPISVEVSVTLACDTYSGIAQWKRTGELLTLIYPRLRMYRLIPVS